MHLTDAGRGLLEKAFAVAGQYETHLCDGLSPPERDQLIALLDRVGERLGLRPGSPHSHTEDA